jgi:hypothetical protein
MSYHRKNPQNVSHTASFALSYSLARWLLQDPFWCETKKHAGNRLSRVSRGPPSLRVSWYSPESGGIRVRVSLSMPTRSLSCSSSWTPAPGALVRYRVRKSSGSSSEPCSVPRGRNLPLKFRGHRTDLWSHSGSQSESFMALHAPFQR